ncbi:MAG TPA: LacI family DNA-binding transcriptional regulator [Kofleriaceae bacterium]|jgi:LacI family transcriptional regulator|nr:LacI family DNA-binding transcriptional regulator [Kofleriaceae bacterium]
MTIIDVARAARVSVASVSRVVNGHTNVTPGTRQRILEVVDRLQYVPHLTARSLITKRTHVLGVVLPDLYGGFFSELIRGIDAAARELQLHVLLSSSHGDAKEMAAAIRAMHGRVEGLLVLAPELDAAELGKIDADVPTVFMNSRVDDGVSSSLAIDSYRGARAMIRHLVACGHRTIAHVTGPADNFDAHERERGYRDELAASLPAARPLVVRGDFTEASGYAAGQELARTRPRPDAVFAANDMMAIGCLAAFDALGLAVPADIAVTGFDDIPLAALVRPALTTMRVQIVELGRGAVRQLAATIAAPGTKRAITRFQPELVVRESCGTADRRAQVVNPPPVRDGDHDAQMPPRHDSRTPRPRTGHAPRARRRARHR